MKFKTVIGFALAAGALAFTSAAPAQTNYTAEYKMSLVVGPAFPLGQGRGNLGQSGARTHAGPDQH